MNKKELTLEEAENIVDKMYQNRFIECGVEDENTIHIGNLDRLQFNDLERASILLLRTEIRQKRELDQYKNNWEELKKWLKVNDDEHQPYYGAYEYNGEYEDVLNKMKELEEDK